MAYTKQTWADLPSKTTPINATRLGHIEDGIFSAAATADNAASAAGTAVSQIGQVSSRVDTLTGRVNDLDTAVSNKVDKVAGKGLSTNDYDNTDKGKVDSLGTASTKNSTSVVTESSDLVESGAVKDIIGWGNKNLFDPNSNKNEWVTSSNQISTSRAEVKSVRVNCSEGDTLTLSNNNVASSTNILLIAYLDSQDNVLSRTVKGSADKFVTATAPSNTVCAICSFYTWAEVSKAQLEVGTTATAYEPYHASVEESLEQKCDNSTIAPTENGTTVQKSNGYPVGSHAIRNGAFITWKNAKAQGETINDASDYTSGDVADELDVVDITSELTFSPDCTWNNSGTYNKIYKYGNLIKGFLRFTTPSTDTYNKAIVYNFPDVYQAKNSPHVMTPIFGFSDNSIKGSLLWNNSICLRQSTWEKGVEVYATFEYLI